MKLSLWRYVSVHVLLRENKSVYIFDFMWVSIGLWNMHVYVSLGGFKQKKNVFRCVINSGKEEKA